MLFQYAYTSGGQIQNVFQILQSWGFVDALLPFLLIFTLIFATLEKIELFKGAGKSARKLHGIIGFTISLLVVVPHITRTYPPQSDPILIINNILPGAAILLVVILSVLIMLGLVGGKIPRGVTLAVGAISLVILGIVVLQSIFPMLAPSWAFFDPNTQALVIVLLVMGLVGYFVLRDEEEAGKPGEGILETLKKWFQ